MPCCPFMRRHLLLLLQLLPHMPMLFHPTPSQPPFASSTYAGPKFREMLQAVSFKKEIIITKTTALGNNFDWNEPVGSAATLSWLSALP